MDLLTAYAGIEAFALLAASISFCLRTAFEIYFWFKKEE